MKKPLALCLSALIFLAALTACAAASDGTDTSKRAPTLEAGLPNQSIRAMQLTTSWSYLGGGYEADSPHPLQLGQDAYDDFTLRLDNTEGDIELQFSGNRNPQLVSVQRWLAGYAAGGQDILDMLDKGEPVEVSGNTIRAAADGHDYIYEVWAKWSTGSSQYAFRTFSGGA